MQGKHQPIKLILISPKQPNKPYLNSPIFVGSLFLLNSLVFLTCTGRWLVVINWKFMTGGCDGENECFSPLVKLISKGRFIVAGELRWSIFFFSRCSKQQDRNMSWIPERPYTDCSLFNVSCVSSVRGELRPKDELWPKCKNVGGWNYRTWQYRNTN